MQYKHERPQPMTALIDHKCMPFFIPMLRWAILSYLYYSQRLSIPALMWLTYIKICMVYRVWCRFKSMLAGATGPRPCLVNLYPDGSVLVTCSGTEMGQGLFTKAKQVGTTA